MRAASPATNFFAVALLARAAPHGMKKKKKTPSLTDSSCKPAGAACSV
jgi:hypothetical protein